MYQINKYHILIYVLSVYLFSFDFVCFCPEKKKKVAILDSTVKVFHDDSLKFFLSLYGHKLPVMSMDISDDGTLLATGSADKTVKIWGLDFGDCHRSLLAHDDSIMVCMYLRNN